MSFQRRLEKVVEILIHKLRKELVKGSLDINELANYQEALKDLYNTLMSKKVLSNEEFDDMTDLIMLYLDYYTYSEIGDVLVTDHEYDLLMNHYVDNGGKPLSHADKLSSQTRWPFVRHESPGMVGTVKKCYSLEELAVYWGKYQTMSGYRKWRIAPKFDGISSAIKINYDGRILKGVTRNDGVEGQDVTKVVKNASNAKKVANFYASKLSKGESCWVKTELVVATDDFEELIQHKLYKNRRSATSGIINSPKNLKYAKYVTIIPLAAHFTSKDDIDYVPLDSYEAITKNPYELMENIEHLLSKIRDSKYPFRTDGVVIYPLGDDIIPNYNDIMDHAIAYKVNTAEGLTEVDYGYVSVGRLGYAIPMLHVKPVEVNETIVQDVSLGSFDKFAQMDIHEGEQVLVYSAGDVIPQAKIPEERHYNVSAPLLKIKKRCPYCGEKLTRYKSTYKCENKKCPRVQTGRITNFLVKLKVENVSDRTVEDLVNHKLIKDIPDLFHLNEKEIAQLPGYGEDSANQIIREIDKLQKRDVPISSLLGALGIQGISEKKSKKIFEIIDLKTLFKKDRESLIWDLLDAESTGRKTAEIFVDFVKDNKDLIKELTRTMNIVNDISWKGNVVFTGFRNPELEKRFNEIHYEVSNNVNSNTAAVIDASWTHDSTKCKAAKKKGIEIYQITEAEELLGRLG